ncbi:MAG: radical SAM protein [Bryobacterales bacterium]|nr:radical SAM protein [Bryobacterales bacterium]
MAAPRSSAEVFLIPLDDARYVVYAPLRRCAFIANRSVVRFLASIQNGKWESSADPDGSLTRFLRELKIVDAGPEPLPGKPSTGPPEPTALTLLLTTVCNLRCTYCYASAGEFPVRFMSMDVARRGIDFVAANAARRKPQYFEVGFHGPGEPTLNWEVLTGSVKYAREKSAAIGVGVQTSVATNGVFSDKQIDWIVGNLSGANVSFDGLPAMHDSHRKTKTGAGSSAKVMHTLRRFDESRFAYGVRITVMADHIATLPEAVDFIYSEFRPSGILIEPVYHLGRGRQTVSAETEDFVTAFRAARERARRHGRMIAFSAARADSLTIHYCGLSQDSFCLAPDGEATGCYEVWSKSSRWAKLFFIGEPSGQEGYKFDLPVVDHLRSQTVLNRPFCQGCFAKWHCGGDCYHKALELNAGGEFRGAGRCHITRELTKDRILERISESGGVVWRG